MSDYKNVVEGHTGADTRADERLTLRQAAAHLGVSESAIRKRVERGTLRSDKGPDGRRYVYLDVTNLGADTMADKGVDSSAPRERDALISQLRGENEFLRDQVRRQQEIIAQQAVTMRQLSAAPSQEPTEDVETVEEEPEGAEHRSDSASPQAGAQRPQGGGLRDLRRRILGW